MRFCTVHTHSLLCDGKDTLEEMARAAFDAGAVSFGASGHSYTPIPWDAGNVLPETAEEYRAEVLRLRKAYEGRMEVLLGIEQDSQSLQPVPDWAEYWIGSVHNLRDPRTGKWYCVDWDPERLETCRREMFGGDGLAMARGYYADVAAMAQRRPTILGHLDLIVKLNRKGCFFDEAAPAYRSAALETLHAANPDTTLLEINTGAMARGYRDAPYPALFLLREWRTMGGRIILTADAHSAVAVTWAYSLAAELARTAGFREHTLLTRRGPVPDLL